MYCPCQLPGRASAISGELQAGGNSICLCLTGVSYNTQKATMDTYMDSMLTVFVIRILSTYLIPVSISLSSAALGIYLYGISYFKDMHALNVYLVKILCCTFQLDKKFFFLFIY
jgi:hypothetical protein